MIAYRLLKALSTTLVLFVKYVERIADHGYLSLGIK